MALRAAWLALIASGCVGGSAGSSQPAASPAAVVARPGDLAITDVSVLPMSSDEVLPHRTVVVRGDRIVAVAPRDAVALPDGVTAIEGAGRWLMPGLADMHVHTWSEDDLILFVAAGVTTVRNMWGVPWHLAVRSRIARGEVLGPTLVTAGALIDGDPPDWPGSVTLTDPAAADALVVAQRAAGYDFLKSVARLSPPAYTALAAAARRHGMALAGHVPYAVGLDGALAARQRSIEHLDGYLGALVSPGPALPGDIYSEPWLRAMMARRDRSRLPGLVERTIAAGTWNCPTLVTNDRLAELYDLPAIERRVHWLGLIPDAVRARWAHDFELGRPPAADAAGVRAFNLEVNGELAAITAALFAAGAPVLVGTDSGGPYVVAGESLHDEIELMAAAGVSRARVLRAATADAARFLGSLDRSGVVEVGARADLILLAGDPRAAPLPLVPDGVVLRGRWLPRATLEARLAEVARRGAPPRDPWAGAPAPATPGAASRSLRYDTELRGVTVEQERVTIGDAGGEHVITGQIADLGRRIETSYQLRPRAASVAVAQRGMKLELTGAIAAATLTLTGTDLTGAAVSRRAPVPAGAFLSAPGLGGAIALGARLGGMKPGDRRTLRSVELQAIPTIEIVTTPHVVVRRPDAGGHRVFAVSSTRDGATVLGELIVDDDGVPVTMTLEPPTATTSRRR